MPEFILDHGSSEAAAKLRECDAFTQGYVEAMFFTSTGTGDDDLERATLAELAPRTWESIMRDCEAWQLQNAGWLSAAYDLQVNGAYYEPVQAGRDYWFTRQGHGVGFWDRGLGKAGEKLSEAANGIGAGDLYRGDDGLLYLD